VYPGLGVEPVVADLAAADLIDQVTFTREPEFVFRHPLVRAVAYEAQLKSDRAGCTGGWPPRSNNRRRIRSTKMPP
jgi:hypothetical protein